MVVGDLNSSLGSQANFFLWDMILVDEVEDGVEAEKSKWSCVAENKRGMVVVEE